MMSASPDRDGTGAAVFAGDWSTVPAIVRGVANVAPILNRGARSIERDLALGRMRPAPRRRAGLEPWAWSKSALRRHVEEGV
mgnify:FL=1